ncbi:MAG: zinc metallopeptidase [Desulfobacterales bacterium]|nr:zinc metallopeptidase [Desulfobacterales bacterium]
MKDNMHRIGVVCLGDVDSTVPKVLAAHISGYLNLDASVLPPLYHPAYALNRQRLQYDAGVILKEMESTPFDGMDKVIGVLGVDLFVPIFTHVFGEARQGGKAALVSLSRLGEKTVGSMPMSSAVLERAAKITLHELCHLYNLSHCMDPNCLMHFSGDLNQLDQTPFSFCRYCAVFFRDAVGAGSAS